MSSPSSSSSNSFFANYPHLTLGEVGSIPFPFRAVVVSGLIEALALVVRVAVLALALSLYVVAALCAVFCPLLLLSLDRLAVSGRVNVLLSERGRGKRQRENESYEKSCDGSAPLKSSEREL